MKSGELFAGVGGLGMAVDAVFGTRPAYFAEVDEAPSRVLAYHYPDVPNYGDVTAIDFRTVPHTTVRVGGFPCQDVSLAGGRRGMRVGTRSGLWSEFARSIEEDRPDWVVIENVRGLLSAEASGDVEPCPWCLGDHGEQSALRALGAVLADLAALGFDAEWTGIRASDVGAPHGRFRVFILAWPRERTAADAAGERQQGRQRGGYPTRPSTTASHQDAAADAGHRSGVGERPRERSRGDGARPALTLLGTPRTAQGIQNDLRDPSVIGNPRGRLEDQVALLPTPDAYAAGRGGSQHPDKRRAGGHTVSLADVTERTLMPTPRATSGGSSTELAYNLGGYRSDEDRSQGRVLLPTPQVADATGGHATRSGTRSDEKLLPGVAVEAVTDWGPYAPAVERWERITRPAPSPARMDGKGGRARLSPELPEWMMGWPAGWVTDPAIGLSRAAQLKAAGNGVCPQQAAVALREMLARPGVPAIEWGLAA